MQRPAQRGSRVAGRGLHPQLLERPLGRQPGVGHTIQCHPTGHREPACASAPVQPPGQLQQHLLQPGLHGGGEIHVLGLHLLIRRPPLC
jgi:hypothetical protein